MPPQPPFDRAIALACTMNTLQARCLFVRCACGASHARPVQLMLQADPAAAGSTLADVLVRVRCYICRRKTVTIHLCADAHGPGPLHGGPEPGWSVLLHGDEQVRN